ncbi:MAG: hemolysin family protein [Pseudorhodoplanes sp.]
MLFVELAIVFVLIVINGLLSMSELAVVSSRPARLKAMVDRQVTGSRRALTLASDPGRFLSTVQIGITLVGVLSGAFSGATLGLRLSEWLITLGLSSGIASALGVGVVVTVITYASLIAGELVPKQIALRNPEAIAVRVAPAMTFIARIASPLVWFLDASGKALLRVLGQQGTSDDKVTDEEIRTIIAEAESAGVIEPAESKMISGVMRLGDRPVKGIMTPRTEVDWIDVTADESTIRQRLMQTPHSRIPAAEGEVDQMIGVIQTRELLAAMLTRDAFDIRAHVHRAPVMPDNADALDAMQVLRKAKVPMALVHDEYGHFEGVVTPADLLETIAGVFRSDSDETEPAAVRREDGSWLVAGFMPADEMADLLGIPLPEERGFETAAGFVLSHLQHLPTTGEVVDVHGWRFEVVDMDGRRIDKILIARRPPTRREART